MEKRLLIAVCLSGIILVLWLFLMPPSKQPTSTSQTFKQKETCKKRLLSPQPEDIKVTSSLMTVYLSKEGNIKSLKLNNYLEKDRKKVELAPLVIPVPQKTSTTYTYPLGLYLFNEPLKLKEVSTSKEEKAYEFTYYLESRPYLEVIKKLKFNDDSYLINMDLIIKNHSNKEIHIFPKDSLAFSWSGLSIPIKNYSFIVQEIAFNSGKIVRKNIVSSGRKEAEGAISWCSLLSKYFLVAFIPTMNLVFHKVNFINELETTKMIAKLPTIKLLPSCSYKTSVNIYAGPIRYQNLKAITVKSAVGIEKLAGMNILSRIILKLLNFFYQFTHNYGIAIILLTVVIKIILYPLSLQSLKAMRQMQKLQPLLTKLKEKYKNNKEALNREIILLYKRHKVNPFGGCLPLLLQLPIFFALYATLTKAIELRSAEFVLWIKDLSVKDPYFILPILMGITMFLQQKFTSHYESTQVKFMYILPIFFTFIFISFPAGLVLYWLVHNILSIAEQKFFMRYVK